MSRISEKINIITMFDSGRNKSLRINRSLYRAIIIFFVFSPFIAVLAMVGNYMFWQKNLQLISEIEMLKQDNGEYQATLQRFAYIESMLGERRNSSSIVALDGEGNFVEAPVTAQASEEEAAVEVVEGDVAAEPSATSDGPGHEVFPAINTGEVIVENVEARITQGNTLHTSLDLRNDNDVRISGEVFCFLVLDSGESIALVPNPARAGRYSIMNFKDVALFASLSDEYDMANAQLVIEIKNANDDLIFRNLYPIEQ